jgi:mRNA interferase RelE/StbE
LYSLRFTHEALKDLKKFDPMIRKMLLSWIDKNLSQLENPRTLGKPLKGKLKEFWRYRVGDYRLLCAIEDQVLVLLVITVRHRKEAY